MSRDHDEQRRWGTGHCMESGWWKWSGDHTSCLDLWRTRWLRWLESSDSIQLRMTRWYTSDRSPLELIYEETTKSVTRKVITFHLDLSILTEQFQASLSIAQSRVRYENICFRFVSFEGSIQRFYSVCSIWRFSRLFHLKVPLEGSVGSEG